MTDKNQPEIELLLNGEPYRDDARCDRKRGTRVHWKRRLLICVLMIETCFVLPKFAHGQFLSVFDSIFSSIQNDIGSSFSHQPDHASRPRSSIRQRWRHWRPSIRPAGSSPTQSTAFAGR